ASAVLAIAPLVMIPLVLRMPEPPRLVQDERGILPRTRQSLGFLIRREPRALAPVAALGVGGNVANLFLLPFALREIGVSAAATGGILIAQAVGWIIGSPIMGRLGDRYGIRRPLVGAMAITIAALSTLVIIGPQPPVS